MDPARLAALPLFAPLSTEELARVASAMEEVSVEAGQELCCQGTFAYQFFVIEEGTVDVLVDGGPVAELTAGDFFGEVGLLVTGRRSASVVARTPMRLLVLFDQPFRELTRDVPGFAERVRDALGDRPWVPGATAHASGRS